jgi:hypothetical protein
MFVAELRTTSVDATAPDSERLAAVLRCDDEYVAVTQDGRFTGLLERAVVARHVLADLVAPSAVTPV